MKFTNEGGLITLSIASEGNKVLFKISDTGIGIPPNQLSAVFDRYMTDSDKDKKGTGLGLAIANKIMELHSSKIYVLSKLNEGTTFSFSLPVHI
ncbi:MAG TPA: ATP-binding protein [Saprospiraceae bacterium]|nr:ATP-binding protein [Saprospiraceae bacterium]